MRRRVLAVLRLGLSGVLLLSLIFLQPLETMAISKTQRNMFAQNNILFYDPSADNCKTTYETAAYTNSSSEGAFGLSSQQVNFVEMWHDTAVVHSINYGIPWETVVAQGILESASGTSSFAVNRNNFFGIGAFDSNPNNAFNYATPEEGWEGYYKNIQKTSVYREHGVFSGETVTNPHAYLVAIKEAGYATDPAYIAKIDSIITAIESLSKERGWPGSAELANMYPEWFDNAEANRQGVDVAAGGMSAEFYDATKCKSDVKTLEGVTHAEYNGYDIAFPIAYATKQTISGGRGEYINLSNIPCNHEIGCHYGPGNPAGMAAAAFDICMNDSVACVGATVVSITDGEIVRVTHERNGVPCNHIRIRSAIDGTTFAYMHLEYDAGIVAGTQVKAGDVIGHVGGTSACHDNSVPHVHIDKGKVTGTTGGPTSSERDPAIVPIINAAYAALPEDEEELMAREAEAAGELTNGGMTLAEAQEFMEVYAKESDKFSRGTQNFLGATILDAGCPSGTLNNCSAFTQWFLNKYTTLGPSGANLIQGSQAVKRNLAAHPELIDGGKVPRPYAIMSQGPMTGTADGWGNHTAIVLGIDAANDQIILGEASCGASRGQRSYRPGAHVYSLSKYTNSSSRYGPTYAYTDNVLRGI